MSTILITGWQGTLGRALTDELRGRGHIVWGTDLLHHGDPMHIRADVGNMRQMEHVFEVVDPDHVYHFAAEFGRRNGEEFYEQVWNSNAIGTRNMLELCHAAAVPMYFSSSSEVYGERVPQDEEGNPLPLHESYTDQTPQLTNEYAISKWTNELQIRNFVSRYGSDVTVMRFFNDYGPGEFYTPYRSVVALFCWKALNGIPFDVFEGAHRTFIHVDDFAPTLANVMASGIRDNSLPYNIGGTDYRSVLDLANIVVAAADADPALIRYRSVEKHNVLTKIPDIARAKRDFNHDPKIKLEEGVPDTIEWMKQFSHSVTVPAF